MDIFSEKTILTVSRLTALLRGVLEENFEHVWVQGEISNLSFPSSGHIYFSLKDAGSQLRCIMFKGAAKNLKFRPADGMGLITRGRISVYDQRGEYQLICEYIEPAGIGALQMAFMQLKQRLADEGLFDERHKKPMPSFPRRVGVVTSATGAAIHDILKVLKRRFASLEVLLYPVRVQGEGSALEIARAIDDMNRLNLVDVMIVGRGGGSLEDLWAFNEESVARAVHRSRIPVISAVGHETDWTICDFAADLRAPTPSAAAEMVIASSIELRNQLDALTHRLNLAMRIYLSSLSSRMDAVRRSLHEPRTLLGHLTQRVDDLTERLDLALENATNHRKGRYSKLQSELMHLTPLKTIQSLRQQIDLLSEQSEKMLLRKLDGSRHSFGNLAGRLEVLSPLATLSRGYAIAQRCDGSIVVDSTQLAADDQILLQFSRGKACCRVTELENP
jgi:exodeoxyribonuclease VII large subunit